MTVSPALARPPPSAQFARAAPAVVLLALVALVTGAHLWLAERLVLGSLELGSAGPQVRRLDIAFVRELLPAAPPTGPLRAPPAAARSALTKAPPPAAAASAPEPSASAPEPAAVAQAPPLAVPPVAAELPDPLPDPVLEPTPVLAEAPAAAASASALPAFEWPASTRLTYTLTGYYRGPVEGQAQVEWLRQGRRYQVHVEVSIGPFFAPLVTRRLVSDGEISELGLVPLRYHEETKVAWLDPRRRQISIDGDRVRLADGREVPRPSGLQDSASQFVQMIWWFTTSPERLQPGRAFDIPLALPGRVEPWRYEVIAHEAVHTPVGVLDTVHVKPRRAARAGNDLVAESWIAPSLLYLPVRIVIRQDEETYVDLLLDRLPQQSAAAPAPGSAPTR